MHYEVQYGRLTIDIDEHNDGIQITDFLKSFHISSAKRNDLFSRHEITLNRKDAVPSDVLHARDRIVIQIPDQEIDYKPAEAPCPILYEDDLIYVAHKDPGIIVHDPQEDCLAARAAAYQISAGILQPVRYIHRLDRETTGLVLFVKVPLLQGWYDAMLEEKLIRRRYLAVTGGKGHRGQKFTYNQKIGRDRHQNNVYRFSSTGKEAVTKAVILDRKKDWLLFRCDLETGRTHQIRVHLSGNRHPIVNDPVYGIPSAEFQSMCLWADTLMIPDPFTEEIITVTDTPNPDFSRFAW
jgi:23S rRNA pseudouridine1911/1915/1917 synthase